MLSLIIIYITIMRVFWLEHAKIWLAHTPEEHFIPNMKAPSQPLQKNPTMNQRKLA